MAAYDLTVQRPSLLAIPDTFNKSANNVLNAVRLAQERKNNEDKIELDRRRQSFIEGAPQRERDAQKALNESLSGGLQATRQNFIDNFVFNEQTRKAIESDERYANATAEQQKAYWDTVTGKINANIGKNTDPRLYEGNLRAQLAKTSATQEQIDNYVANEMTRVYGSGDTDLAKTLAAASLRSSGGSQGGYNKLPRMDDPGFSSEERKFVKEWLGDAGAAKGNGKSLWNPLSWFDPGGNNLTEQNVNSYVNSMRNNHGLTAAQSLQALEAIRDGDELEVNFNEMMNADINGNSNASKALRKVVTAGMGMRDLRLQGTAAGGNQTGSSGDFASILASASRRGTTVSQRRDLLFAELTTHFGPKAAKEMAEEATGSEVPESVVEKVEESVNTPENTETQTPVSQSAIGNDRNALVEGFAQLIGGKSFSESPNTRKASVLANQGGNLLKDILVGNGKGILETAQEDALVGLLERGYNNTPASYIVDNIRKMVVPTREEEIESLRNELKNLDTSNPDGLGARRAVAINKEIEKLTGSGNAVASDLDLLRSLAEMEK